MAQSIFLVDAFASAPFTGNPAAVVPLAEAAEETWMQRVAMEMNQSETAFVWPEGEEWRLRWFTPALEVDLCGHATMAAAEVLKRIGAIVGGATFQTKSGPLGVRRDGADWVMDFPAEPGAEHTERGDMWQLITEVLGQPPIWFGRNRMDWLAQTDEATVRGLKPNMTKVAALGMRGLIVTAMDKHGQDYDFVSRFFAPQSGVPEDAVTGSAHCFLGPFWAERWAKKDLVGYQASRRGGIVGVLVSGDRCLLRGRANLTVRGELLV